LRVVLTVAVVGLAGACSSNDTTETGGDAESSSSTTSSAGGGTAAGYVPSEIDGEEVSSCEFVLTDVNFDADDQALVTQVNELNEACIEWGAEHPQIATVSFFVTPELTGSTNASRQAASYREQYADQSSIASFSAGDCTNWTMSAGPEEMGTCKTGIAVAYRDELPAEQEARVEALASTSSEVTESEMDGFRVLAGQGIAVALGDDAMLVASASDPEAVLQAMIDANG
jgi:hypothetical protein